MPLLRNRDPVRNDVIIIGAGASGLFCAIECGKRGRTVLVLDHAERTCSKVLISGGGRCNFTNLNVTPDDYLSGNPHFCRSALARFSPADFLALLAKHGVSWYEKEAGQLFCTKHSREIVSMLERECANAGVGILTNRRIEKVRKESEFVITTGQGAFRSESLVIATGGLSYANLGATGFGHALARQFGLAVTEVRPGLVPFTFSPHDRNLFRDLAGISLYVGIRCCGGEFRGNVLFTHRGLSGPAALQASSWWRKGNPFSIDLFPDTGLHEVFVFKRRSRMELKTLLARHFPKRFAEAWCALFAPSKPLIQYTDKELRGIESRLHAWEIRPNGTEGYRAAEVTAGGVDTSGISSKTMEAKNVSGLYFIGEVLDVTGRLGGYNLHWAWASGHAAGQFA